MDTFDIQIREVISLNGERLAIRDAMQERDRRLREEALHFLWSVAPGVAERAELPAVAATRAPHSQQIKNCFNTSTP